MYSYLLLVTLINLRKIKSLEDLSIPMLLILLFFSVCLNTSKIVCPDKYPNNIIRNK